MNFTCKKTENCFADSQTYEYVLPITGEELLYMMALWETRRNDKLRRPTFAADRDGVNLKGALAGNIARVSYPTERWEAEKAKFEDWLRAQNV